MTAGTGTAPFPTPRPTSGTQRTPATPPRRVGRLGGVDGLRALAVVLVLVYHLVPGRAPGGVVGVDVFFVISGFLISALLLDERRRTGRVALGRFWVRRLRRLVPALTVAVGLTTAAAALVGGDVLVAIRRQVLGALAFVYNWVEILAGSSYFDQTQPLLLTNMWSLAVEEQFYLLWPLLLLLVLRGRLSCSRVRLAAMVALCVAAGSGALALVLTARGVDPNRVYMGTDTHSFGLMLGSALALAHGHALDTGRGAVNGPVLRTVRGLLGWAGVAVITLCGLADPWPAAGGGTAPGTLMVASLGAVAVLQSLTREVADGVGPGRVLARVLDLPALSWVGERSYGIYLWHWPLWVLAFYALPGATPSLVVAGVAVLSVVAAHLSYRYVETPIRREGLAGWLLTRRRSKGRRSVAQIALATGAVVLLAASGFLAQPRMSSAEVAIAAGSQALAAQDGGGVPQGGAVAGAATTAAPVQEAVSGDQVTIVGDSVTLASSAALTAELPGVSIDAAVSRSVYAGLGTLQALDAQVGARPYVVIGLATNGEVRTDQLQAILDYLGPERRLVLVTAYGPPHITWIPGADQSIRDFAAVHPDQVQVAGWDEQIAGHTDLLAEDQVHPGADGGVIYAQAVVDALNAFTR